jgi:hypothetical protein
MICASKERISVQNRNKSYTFISDFTLNKFFFFGLMRLV